MQARFAADELISEIYSAVESEGGWEEPLDKYARAIGGYSAAITWHQGQKSRSEIVTTGTYPRDFVSRYARELEPPNPFHNFFASRPVGNVTAVGIRSFDKEYLSSAYFNEWARPQGFGDLLGGHLLRGPFMHSWLSIRRDFKKGPYSPHELTLARKVAPHLARALALWARVQAACTEGASAAAALDEFGCAVILVDAEAKILYANRLGEGLLTNQTMLLGVRGYIACRRHDDTTALRATIRLTNSSALLDDPHEGVVAILDENGEVSVIYAVPLSVQGRFGGLGSKMATVGLFVADHGHQRSRTSDALVTGYRLTRMEGRVLEEVVAGGGLVCAARNLKIGLTTARSHLQQVFAKTGTRKQAELVRLYCDVTVPLLKRRPKA